MHFWGDEWFKEHGSNLYSAIEAVEERMRKWAKVAVCGKEKYGTYRDEYLRMWDGGIFQILFGYKISHKKWYENLLYKIDHNLIPIKKTQFGWYKVGLSNFNNMIGLTKLVWKWQAKMINKSFQITCKEYPDVVDELIVCADCYEMIKPCKWGNIDGEAIHKKYWKPLKKDKDEQ